MLQIPKVDRPRERLIKYGGDKLSNQELLAILLRTGNKDKDVLELAKEILSKFSNLSDFQHLSVEELKKIGGIGEAKAVSIIASIEFGRRINNSSLENLYKVNCSQDLGKYLSSLIGHYAQEVVVLICLNNKNEIIKLTEVFKGSLTESIIHPRELYNIAIRNFAAKIIIAHNHPSNHVDPSEMDFRFTNRLIECGKIIGIPLIDHFIVTKNNYFSFCENNLLDE